MNYNIKIEKKLSGSGYWIVITFFDSRGSEMARYTTETKTKKEAKEWERKNKTWITNARKFLNGV